tara:strand:- start:48 stop:461 length:414 start_codon:yes stop_codon:yes gene_type:complete
MKYLTQNKESICNILKQKNNHKINILILVSLFGYFVLKYENERKDKISYYLILVILLNLIGLIICLENKFLHDIFTPIIFISILLFMINTTQNSIQASLLLINIIMAIIIKKNRHKNILLHEVIFLLIFALHYLLLH